MYEVHITLHNMKIRVLDMYTWDRLVVNELLNFSWLLMASGRFNAKEPAMYTRFHGICTCYEFRTDLHDLFTVVPHGCINNTVATDLIHKSQNSPVPYPTMLHSKQKCAHSSSIVWFPRSQWSTCERWDQWQPEPKPQQTQLDKLERPFWEYPPQ